jgi:hypothetical protein
MEEGNKGAIGFQLEEAPFTSFESPENPKGKNPQVQNEESISFNGGERITTA